jgi:hypothetical protein
MRKMLACLWVMLWGLKITLELIEPDPSCVARGAANAICPPAQYAPHKEHLPDAYAVYSDIPVGDYEQLPPSVTFLEENSSVQRLPQDTWAADAFRAYRRAMSASSEEEFVPMADPGDDA